MAEGLPGVKVGLPERKDACREVENGQPRLEDALPD